MGTVNATIQCDKDKYFIEISLASGAVRIPLSEDSPKQVKQAFNRLIEHARAEEYTIEFEGVQEDLFSQVASEYLRQLNREIQEVRAEMKQYKLLSADAP